MRINIFLTLLSLLIIPLALYARARLRIKNLKKVETAISGIITVDELYRGKRRLVLSGCTQGFRAKTSDISGTYWEYIAQKCIDHCKNIQNPEILFLGLGANTSSYVISHTLPNANTTIIEIDKVIIDVCQEYFDTDDTPNLKIINADAYQGINDSFGTHKLFDVVILDIFDGKDAETWLNSGDPEYIQSVVARTNKHSLLVFNRPAHTERYKQYTEKLVNFLKENYQDTYIKYIEDKKNNFKNEIVTTIVNQ